MEMEMEKRESSLVQKTSVIEEKKEPIIKQVSAQCRLRVRRRPNKDGEILGLLEPNTKVEVLYERNGWSTIKYNDRNGYVMSQWLIG